ncbi:hypothetical protein FRB98_002604 [Tulasnella sp. 332]|nr:hypothetical protein FRB98_002604 [Tulasnella sp. 332]
MTTVEWLTFSGGPSDNILRFAKAVHQFAFAHGRQKDGVWMADYVYGCLDDEALEWFEDLEPKIREDWTHLRSAMMKEFRQSKFVPTAPPAAMGPRVVVPSSTAHARVKIINKKDKVVGYVGPLNEAGINVIQQNSEGALVLEIPLMQPLTQVGASVRIVGLAATAAHEPLQQLQAKMRTRKSGPFVSSMGQGKSFTYGAQQSVVFWISKGQLLGGECMKFVLERF